MCWKVARLCFLFFWPLLAWGQGEERQLIYLESDSLTIDDVRGLGIYQGNVVLTQGGRQIWADRVVVHSRDREGIESIVSTGQPARFRFLPPANEGEAPPEEVTGQAERIEYWAAKGLMLMVGEARLMQVHNEFSGNRIEYHLDTRTVKAGQTPSAKGTEGRVKVVIQPPQRKPVENVSRDLAQP